MTPQENPRTEERHEDIMAVVTIGKEIRLTILRYILPAIMVGVGVLVANHFNQAKLVEQFAEFKRSFSEFQREQRTYNERTSEMWYRGGYGTKREEK
jgi:hypothetical protein